ncbi:hydrolase [Mangrovactinospora gilvigrisea]|uniref:Hydrolase n=1 Tax=Mangrovactinospora gilvigrisea TaxID=1428644 RepID=A0A1J7B9K8_9ACTN|nr:HAD-IB family hydrolase [Mangrovactinospora gilvigrisea]OIV35294.1 hydrolase [Mangrovactinospora gilvigrisea]
MPGAPSPSAAAGRPVRAAAFFDLDNTLLQGAALFHIARGLYARRFFGPRDLARYAARQTLFRVRAVEDMAHLTRSRDEALALIAGRPEAELRAMVEEIYDEFLAARIWPGTRALAQAHLDRGEPVWILTAAPAECAETIAARLGLTGGLGTVAETSSAGTYTGRLRGAPLHGPEKAAAVRRLAAAEGWELGRCSAYSDSSNDLPMLEAVGRPVAVNPDAELRRRARELGWPVRDFRTARKAVRAGAPALAAAGVGAALALAAARSPQHAGQRSPRR